MSDARPSERGEPQGVSRTRVFLRPLGNPLPVTFIGLAAASLLLSSLQLGWFPTAEGDDVALLLVAFAVPLQALAAVLGFLARDPAGGTGAAVLAGAWLATGLTYLTQDPSADSGPLGLLLLVAAAGLLVPAAAATLGKPLAAGVLLLAAGRFAAAGIAALSGSGTWEDLAGVLGLVVAGAALYAAAAFELEDARHRTVLPVLRRGAGRKAIEGCLDDQAEEVAREAGVREEL